jgi:DNA-binding MarR family transcriptional regulator
MTYNNPRLKDGFGQCTTTVMRDPSLSMRDKAVYAYLCVFTDSKNNTTVVSVNKIANELSVTPITVTRSLKELETKNVIKRIRRGQGQSSITMILK